MISTLSQLKFRLVFLQFGIMNVFDDFVVLIIKLLMANNRTDVNLFVWFSSHVEWLQAQDFRRWSTATVLSGPEEECWLALLPCSHK